jgi:WD40 repeat protein
VITSDQIRAQKGEVVKAIVTDEQNQPIAYAAQFASEPRERDNDWRVYYRGEDQWKPLIDKQVQGYGRISRINHLAFRGSPDPCLAISGSYEEKSKAGKAVGSPAEKGFTLVAWLDRPDDSQILSHVETAWFAAFGPDGLLVTGDQHNSAKIYSTEDLQKSLDPREQLSHSSDVVFAEFNPVSARDKWMLVTVSSEGEANLWRSEHIAKQTAERRAERDVRAFSPQHDCPFRS